MTHTEFLTLCREAIKKRKEMIESKKQSTVRQLIEGRLVQIEGIQGTKRGHLFQEYVNKQEGNIVYIKGYRYPFTIEGDYLKRGKDLWLIKGQNN